MGYFKLISDVDDTDPHLPDCIKNSNAIMLERFYLDRAHHGRGFANQMMQACIDIAIQLNFNAIYLGVWEKNHRARHFYEKWLFKPVGSHPFIMGNDIQTDHWLMRSIQ